MSPTITALLTTHNRAHLLPHVLASLERQTLPRSQFEIVAVDDGSSDDTPAVLAGYLSKLPLRIFRQAQSGVASAKNLGLFAANSPIIVFLDDDDVLDPDTLRVHLAAHQAHPDLATAILGHTRLAPDVAQSPLMKFAAGEGGVLFGYRWITPGQIYGYREFWGGRSSCKRQFLIEHGVFDHRFEFGYEDIECAWRLQPHKLRVIYEPKASTMMIRTISFDGFCRRSYRQGVAAHRFSQLHDEAEIRAYCDIDLANERWRNDWLNYAKSIRQARELDKLANNRIAEGGDLAEADREILQSFYREAHLLSYAKGVSDARWRAENDRLSNNRQRYGLVGDHANVLDRIKASAPSSSKQSV